MAASHNEAEAFTLIRSKLQRPRLPGDLIPWRRLLDRLHAGSDRKLTLISTMAGTGETTLLALAELILYAPRSRCHRCPSRQGHGHPVYLGNREEHGRRVVGPVCSRTRG